ncbi:MAG TPA: hypothetical protein VHW93_09095, partial [Acidimicrobiales bacterium]|nr:hypothetical protein [Acidimicrobiales bacterium]
MTESAPRDAEAGETAGGGPFMAPDSATADGGTRPGATQPAADDGAPTVLNETPVERSDRQIGPDAPRRERLFAAA